MSNNNNRRSSLIDHHYNYNHSSSFSSSLLEEIYRSFDEDNHEDCNVVSYRKSSSRMMNKSSSCYMERDKNKYESLDNRVRVNAKINLRRNSMAKFNDSIENLINYSSSSTTSSSDSSSGVGGFSSSESESRYGWSKSMLKAGNLALKPIRTSFNPQDFHRKSYSDEVPAKKKKSSHGSNKDGNLQKRALKKLYGDLKKVKQPISPGGKLASFINSLFNSTASKKPKISSSSSVMTSSSSYGEKLSLSTPSTASSNARSCLSKTPSSAGRFEQRSVRFCPVNTVITATAATTNTNSNECYNVVKKGRENDNEELKVKIMEKHRRVEEVAKELLKNYHQGRKFNQKEVNIMINKSISNTKDDRKIGRFKVEDEEDEEDDVSCCSSDLFELENLLDGEVDPRYREELPVYETTHVDTNTAIAKGFIL